MKGLTLEQAYRIMGRLIIDIDGIDRMFGFIPKMMPISCTEKELEIHANYGHRLYLELSHTNNGQSVNIETLAKIACQKTGNKIGQNEYLFWSNQFNEDGILKSGTWFYNDPLVRNATTQFGWRIASEEVVIETTGLDYIDQTDALIEYNRKIFKNRLPCGYEKAISEWQEKMPMLKYKLRNESRDAICREISKAKITSLARESFVSTEYRRLLMYGNEKRKILRSHWSWSNTRSSDGEFVAVGNFDDGGAGVHGFRLGGRLSIIGAPFSCSV